MHGDHYAWKNTNGSKHGPHEALQIALTIESSDLEGLVHFGFARLAMSQGDREEAQRQAQLSIHMLRKMGHELTSTVEQWQQNLAESPI